jgi:CBS domain-containing protein
MLELKLPVVPPETSPMDALDQMFDTNSSGVVVLADKNSRLLEAEKIADGLTNALTDISTIDALHSINVSVTAPDGSVTTLDTPGANRIAMLAAGEVTATLLVEEGEADNYLRVVISRCTNPVERHYYPPRDKSQMLGPNKCFCAYPMA